MGAALMLEARIESYYFLLLDSKYLPGPLQCTMCGKSETLELSNNKLQNTIGGSKASRFEWLLTVWHYGWYLLGFMDARGHYRWFHPLLRGMNRAAGSALHYGWYHDLPWTPVCPMMDSIGAIVGGEQKRNISHPSTGYAWPLKLHLPQKSCGSAFSMKWE
jgi:hypothetical protein